MNTGILLNDLLNEFRARTKNSGRASGENRLAIFDESLHAVYGGSEEFPKYKQLRGYFAKCLTNKTSWGTKEVIKKLDYAIYQVYYNNN